MSTTNSNTQETTNEWTHEQVQNYHQLVDAIQEGDLSRVIDACEDDPRAVDVADGAGRRALHVAAWCDRPDIVKYLLARGADVHAVESNLYSNSDARTALDIAEYEGFGEIANVLRPLVSERMTKDQKKQFKAILGAIKQNDLDAVRSLTEGMGRAETVLKGSLEDGATLLHKAVAGSNDAIVQHLIATGAFEGTLMRYGWQGKDDPLDLARWAKPEQIPILDQGFNALLDDDGARSNLLYRAIHNDDLERVKSIASDEHEARAPLVARTYYRAGPFHTAVLLGHVEIAQYLIEKGAPIRDPVKIDEVQGLYTALEIAQQAKNTAMIAIIEEALAKPEEKEEEEE